LVPLTGQEKADGTRKTREDKDKCFTESRCDDAVERNLSPEELGKLPRFLIHQPQANK
jgi:hypothetical protein